MKGKDTSRSGPKQMNESDLSCGGKICSKSDDHSHSQRWHTHTWLQPYVGMAHIHTSHPTPPTHTITHTNHTRTHTHTYTHTHTHTLECFTLYPARAKRLGLLAGEFGRCVRYWGCIPGRIWTKICTLILFGYTWSVWRIQCQGHFSTLCIFLS